MNILGLIEMHPFDGSDPFICLRIDNNGHMFDLPINEEQLEILVTNKHVDSAVAPTEDEEEREGASTNLDFLVENDEYAPSPIIPKSDDNVMYIHKDPEEYAEYSLGETMWDDDL